MRAKLLVHAKGRNETGCIDTIGAIATMTDVKKAGMVMLKLKFAFDVN